MGREYPCFPGGRGQKCDKIREWAATAALEMGLETPFFGARTPFRPGARQAGRGGLIAELCREQRRTLLQEPAFPAGPQSQF